MRKLFTGLIMMVFAGVACADKPDFSGEWSINIAKSDYGQVPPPQTFVRKIEHAEPSITIVEEQTGPGTTPTSTRTMKTDGKTVTQDINGASVQLTAAWDGSALLAKTVIDGFGVAFRDRMTLSDDGKVMTSVVQIESLQGSLEIRIVFDRK